MFVPVSTNWMIPSNDSTAKVHHPSRATKWINLSWMFCCSQGRPCVSPLLLSCSRSRSLSHTCTHVLSLSLSLSPAMERRITKQMIANYRQNFIIIVGRTWWLFMTVCVGEWVCTSVCGCASASASASVCVVNICHQQPFTSFDSWEKETSGLPIDSFTIAIY